MGVLATVWHAYCASNLISVDHSFPSNVLLVICVFVVENPVFDVNVFLFIDWLFYDAFQLHIFNCIF